jgi:hypothetical protein
MDFLGLLKTGAMILILAMLLKCWGVWEKGAGKKRITALPVFSCVNDKNGLF